MLLTTVTTDFLNVFFSEFTAFRSIRIHQYMRSIWNQWFRRLEVWSSCLYTVKSGRRLPAFLRNVLPPLSGSKWRLTRLHSFTAQRTIYH